MANLRKLIENLDKIDNEIDEAQLNELGTLGDKYKNFKDNAKEKIKTSTGMITKDANGRVKDDYGNFQNLIRDYFRRWTNQSRDASFVITKAAPIVASAIKQKKTSGEVPQQPNLKDKVGNVINKISKVAPPVNNKIEPTSGNTYPNTTPTNPAPVKEADHEFTDPNSVVSKDKDRINDILNSMAHSMSLGMFAGWLQADDSPLSIGKSERPGSGWLDGPDRASIVRKVFNGTPLFHMFNTTGSFTFPAQDVKVGNQPITFNTPFYKLPKPIISRIMSNLYSAKQQNGNDHLEDNDHEFEQPKTQDNSIQDTKPDQSAVQSKDEEKTFDDEYDEVSDGFIKFYNANKGNPDFKDNLQFLYKKFDSANKDPNTSDDVKKDLIKRAGDAVRLATLKTTPKTNIMDKVLNAMLRGSEWEVRKLLDGIGDTFK